MLVGTELVAAYGRRPLACILALGIAAAVALLVAGGTGVAAAADLPRSGQVDRATKDYLADVPASSSAN
ncbi:MAG: hypothetical protein ACR2K6_10470, partial [Solirubrobacterales bacterium]